MFWTQEKGLQILTSSFRIKWIFEKQLRERERYSTRISNTLTDLMPLVPFYTPWKRLNLWFFMLSGGYRKNQRHKRGSFPKLQNILVHPKIIFKYQDSLMLSTHFFDSRLITDFKSSRPEVFLKILGWGL